MVQIFTLKQLRDKALEKKQRAYVGFVDLEKLYDMFKKKSLF